MSQGITASPAETLRFLGEFRDLTRNLYETVRTATVENAPLDLVDELFGKREHLIEQFGQRTPDLSVEGVRELVAEIQQMDQVVSNCLRILMQGTQAKMHGVQEQKRGTHAYQNEYASSAVFFDRKK